MRNQQSGFTLIELIAVIVILGILAAAAVPRFVNLSNAAEEAAVQGIGANLSAASALNHANNVANDVGLTTTGLIAVSQCQHVASLLETGALPARYVIVTGTGTALNGGGVNVEGGSSNCTVFTDGNANDTLDTGEPSANFVAYGVVTTTE